MARQYIVSGRSLGLPRSRDATRGATRSGLLISNAAIVHRAHAQGGRLYPGTGNLAGSGQRSDGTLNRARAYVEGNLTAGFTYRIMAEYEAGGNASTAASVSLRDAYIRWTRNDL